MRKTNHIDKISPHFWSQYPEITCGMVQSFNYNEIDFKMWGCVIAGEAEEISFNKYKKGFVY